ncbi:MAG: glycerate kinase [Alphaproteobacteria bacterium]|nr:glycerate kinase [Alphaproteobacteria bacterium]
MTHDGGSIRDLLTEAAAAAIRAADPAVMLGRHLPDLPPAGRLLVLGAGKASAAMARAVEAHYHDRHGAEGLDRLGGLIVTRYGHGCPTDRIEIVEASHPVPDGAGLDATRRIMEMAEAANDKDVVLFLVSGGGSALLTAPATGLSFEEKQAVNTALLRSGADIGAMNTVRKHLSAVKGGRLARAAHPAALITLAISDVPGDDLATIASGPTVADPTTLEDARAVVGGYGIGLPDAVTAALTDPRNETPKPGDPIFATNRTHLVATPQASLEAAEETIRNGGFTPIILGDAIEGEAREVGKVMAGIARQIARHGQPFPAPAVLLSGGETTVTVRGDGRGGRNAEFLLGCALALGGEARFHGIAIDTDGIDGSEDNAGARFDPGTLDRARAKGRDPEADLRHNDAYSTFEAAGDLVMTGPTLTNVNDFRAIAILPA